MKRGTLFVAVGGVALSVLAGCSSGTSTANPSVSTSAHVLVGTLRLTPGACGSSGATGTYFRMINPGGSIGGPFFANPDSACSEKTYTLARPGTDGGFVTGTYQSNPSPAFDTNGDALANKIVAPQLFTAIDFAISTNKVDPQTGLTVPVPSISVNHGKLSGQVESWSAAWNKQYFNQGSPKPGGTSPGLTTPVSGSYDARTGAFVLTWASQVVGGPFNGFTGYWHLQGIFVDTRTGSTT